MTGQMRRRIRERWNEIASRLLQYARNHGPLYPPAQMEAWKLLHMQRVEELLRHGVRLRKIRTYCWDDPTYTEAQFSHVMWQAVDNLKKRPRSRPPAGLAKFTSKRLVSSKLNRTTQGDTDVTNGT